MNSPIIAKTEAAIKNGTFGPVCAFRVYARTNSPVHIEAGADFMLQYSFETLEAAQEHADEVNETGFETAVVITA